MTASERIRAARVEKDKHLVSALDQNPVETREVTIHGDFKGLLVGERDGWALVEIWNPFTEKTQVVPASWDRLEFSVKI